MEGTPSAFIVVAQVAYVLLVVGAFLLLPSRRAVLVSVLAGFLFVPVFERTIYEIPFFRTKEAFVPGVTFVASLAFDRRRWTRLRLRLLDLPVVIYCLAPFATSLANDLGAYDGAQAAFQTFMSWGAPYLIGRVYLGDAEGLQEFARAILVGALLYVPLCLWEVRMSPVLHYTVYGFRPWDGFGQSVRFGGYRPSVFMDHGLMLGMFMAGSALVALWLWWSGNRRPVLGIPLGWVASVLTVTALLTKSLGAILLLGLGVAALAVGRRFRTAALVVAIAAVPPLYAGARLAGWSGRDVVQITRDVVNADRAQSLEFRLWNEDMLVQKALERPWLGWGRWGRGRIYDEDGRDISTTDGMWVIGLSSGGLLALVVGMLVLAVPALAALRRLPPRTWRDPRVAAGAALLVWLLLWGVDNLANAMLSPLFPMTAGALSSVAAAGRSRRRAPRQRRTARVRVGPAEPSVAGSRAA